MLYNAPVSVSFALLLFGIILLGSCLAFGPVNACHFIILFPPVSASVHQSVPIISKSNYIKQNYCILTFEIIFILNVILMTPWPIPSIYNGILRCTGQMPQLHLSTKVGEEKLVSEGEEQRMAIRFEHVCFASNGTNSCRHHFLEQRHKSLGSEKITLNYRQ